MARILTEPQIAKLLSERKPITSRQVAILKEPKRGKDRYLRARVYVTGEHGTKFVANVRLSPKDPMEFSVILSLSRRGRKRVNLIRCNGHHPRHPNNLEGTEIPADTCHIHRITKRYQEMPDVEPERFAEETKAYNSFNEAVDYFCWRFGFHIPDDPYRGGLFRDLEEGR